MEGYCVKCKEKREMTKTEEVEMKGRGANGKPRPAMKGTCGTCGTKMFRILPSKS